MKERYSENKNKSRILCAALPQPDARAAPIFCDELDAGRLQGGADSGEGARVKGFTAL